MSRVAGVSSRVSGNPCFEEDGRFALSTVTENALTIRIVSEPREVPVTIFIEVLRETTNLLRDIEAAMSEIHQPTLVWRIVAAGLEGHVLSLSKGPFLMAVRGDAEGREDNSSKVIRAFLEGLRQLEGGCDVPEHFAKSALQRAKKLVGIWGNGVSELQFEAPGHAVVTPTRQVAENVDAILLRGIPQTGRAPAPYLIQIRVPPTTADRIVLAKWHVPDGAYVVTDLAICELDLGDSSGDEVAFGDGILDQIVPAGSVVEIGQLIALIR